MCLVLSSSLGLRGVFGWAKPQRRPHVVDSDLLHRPYTSPTRECRERVPVQICPELTALRVRDPGEGVSSRRRERGATELVELGTIPSEHQHCIRPLGVGDEEAPRGQLEIDSHR
jgi:hypothetical protein